MKKTVFFTGLLTIGITCAFLYLGNIFSEFHSMLLSRVLGITFEIVFLITSILLLIIFGKERNRFFFLTVFNLIVFLVHLILLMTVGFIKPYSYAMDVVISISYTVIFAVNGKRFIGKSA